ncbi:MAG: Flp family type IVb pilin [Thermosediminibacteraceae bacterium]|nr:Flp family type IVb pilin [Thermosediminibacteraceae bacterium]
MLTLVKKLWSDQKGQAMAEYGLILALVAVAAIAMLRLLGTNISARFNEVATEIGPNSGQ